jgi:orotidine-5''-phosphate decarboxylase (EC 4.1.1.23)
MESNIILALDIEDKEKALKMATEVKGLVKAYKVGYPLILSTGSSVVKEVSKSAR